MTPFLSIFDVSFIVITTQPWHINAMQLQCMIKNTIKIYGPFDMLYTFEALSIWMLNFINVHSETAITLLDYMHYLTGPRGGGGGGGGGGRLNIKMSFLLV